MLRSIDLAIEQIPELCRVFGSLVLHHLLAQSAKAIQNNTFYTWKNLADHYDEPCS